jgi:hypothetical protein
MKVPARPRISIARFFASRPRVWTVALIVTGRRREIKPGTGEVQSEIGEPAQKPVFNGRFEELVALNFSVSTKIDNGIVWPLKGQGSWMFSRRMTETW